MIIFKYITRQVLGTTLAVTFILLLVILSGRFIKYLANVASGEMAANILSLLMLYRLPGFLELILPLGFFMSILLVFGRMYADSEIVVMHSGGIGQKKLLSYVLILSTVVALIVTYISWVLVPLSTQKFDQLWNNPNNFRGLSTLIEGRFQDNEGTSWVTYTEDLSADKSNLGLVFMAHPKTKTSPKEVLVIADKGRIFDQNNESYVELFDGYRFVGNAGEKSYQITKYQQYGQKVDQSSNVAQTLQPTESIVELFTSKELSKRAQAHYRIGVPLSLFIMSLFAFVMSKTSNRTGRYGKLLPAIVVYVFYIFLMSAAENYLSEGKIPIALGLWWVHGLFLVLALLVYYLTQGGFSLTSLFKTKSARAA